MGGGTPRKSYTKIKNFTEKDQVRIKYSHIGKDKKLMLSVYIGEDVYNELTNGQNFKRLKVEYIPNDMVIITPTDNEKEGIVHRYNGKGLFKTTCVRLSLSSYKTLKVRKKDFNNRIVGYLFSSRSDSKCLNVDLIGDKRKSKFIHDNAIRENIEKERYSSKLICTLEDLTKPIIISAPDYNDMPTREYIDGPTPMFVSHDFLNDVRDAIENRLLDMEERFEKRMREIESLLEEFMDRPLGPLKPSKENNLDIDTFKQLIGKTSDEMKIRFSNVEKAIVELDIKNSDIKSKLTIILSLISNKKSHEDKSLFERIFGKD